MTTDYEREARYIAKKYYKKDWDKLRGKLREDIYDMAVLTVDMRQTECPTTLDDPNSENTPKSSAPSQTK